MPTLSDKKALLLHNLDPMFNIRVGHFFTCGENSFLAQMEALSIFDISVMRKWAWIAMARRNFNDNSTS